MKQNDISGNLINIITNFLSLAWVNIEAEVPQRSILGSLFFQIYINDLLDDLISNPKLFADDTFLFSVFQNINSTGTDLNSDLSKISDWAFQWKMNFNLDPNKQAQEVVFSRKINKINHPPLLFNRNLIKSSSSHKHLGMVLHTKLDFNFHLKNVQGKVNKKTGFLRKLRNILPRESLITIYKSFIRPHLDYEDIIYDRAYDSSFHQNIESIQYNAAALAITGVIRGTSEEQNLSRIRF